MLANGFCHPLKTLFHGGVIASPTENALFPLVDGLTCFALAIRLSQQPRLDALVTITPIEVVFFAHSLQPYSLCM